MTSSADLVQSLKMLSKLRSSQESGRFLELVRELGLRRDPAIVDDLLLAIDDSCEDYSVMAELWRVIEGEYSPTVFVPALLRNIEPMLEKARDSTFYLHARLLNRMDPESFNLYAD